MRASVRRSCYERACGCCEICGEFAPLDGHELFQGNAHHRLFRSHGGQDDLDNMQWLCPGCHRGIHDGLKPCPSKRGEA